MYRRADDFPGGSELLCGKRPELWKNDWLEAPGIETGGNGEPMDVKRPNDGRLTVLDS